MATSTITSSAWTFPSSCYTSSHSSSSSRCKTGHSRSLSLPTTTTITTTTSFSFNSTSFVHHSTSPTSIRNRPSNGNNKRVYSSSFSCGSGNSTSKGARSSCPNTDLHAATPRSLPRAKTVPLLPRALARLSNQSQLPSMAEFEEIGLGEDTPEASPVKSFFSFSGGSSNNSNNHHSNSNSRSSSFSRRSQTSKQTTLSIPPTIASVPNSPIAAVVPSSSPANPTTAKPTPPTSNAPGSRTLINPSSSSSSSPATTVQGGLSIPAKQSRRRRSPSPSRRSHARTSSRSRSRVSSSPSPARPQHPPQFHQQYSSPNLTTPSSASSSSQLGPPPMPRGPPQRSHTTPANMGPSPRLPRERKPRKTVEEMERECDEESDDEIPENMVFWNVPLSPRAGKSIPSNSPSPERLSLASDSRQSVSTASGEDVTITEEALSRSFSRNGISTPPPRNLSTTSLPISGSFDSPDRGRKKSRGKSWSDVMLELGEDAKELTAALERHAESELAEVEKKLHKAVLDSARTSSPGTNSPIRKDAIALPPKQRGSSVDADPIPVSKEKEAVLSRTRPGWLPPKDPEEEKKHLKQYQEMMRLSLEADRKKAEKLKKEAEVKAQAQISINKVWEDKVIPNWDEAILEPETRELWWNGIAPKLRGLVWNRAFGNVLAVGEDTYQKALQRARKTESDLKGMTDHSIAAKSFHKIRQDVKKTLVEYKLFQESCPLHQSLIDVLMAYTMYRSDIGYVYGLNVIAATLLLNLNASDAFTTLANILNRLLPLSFYSQDESGMTKIYALFLRAFQYKYPRLHNHIHVKLCLPPPLYLEPMLSSLFALHLPIDIVTRILDVYAFEGDALLIRTAVAVMGILESRLYGSKEEVLSILGWDVDGRINGPEREWEAGKESEFMAKVRMAGKEEPGRS